MIESPDDLMKAYEQATASHDLAATLVLIDDAAVYLFSDETVHVGKAAIEQVLRRNFALIEDEVYRLANLTWLVQSAEAAACVYDFSWSGVINGAPAHGAGRGTSVLKRSGAGWRVVHEHLSRGKFAA